MITIQSGMLVALGFLAAMLLVLLVAPAFWARAVRLTTRRLKDTMPLSEMEIEADRDRIRAEYAIKMHKLETLVENVKMAGARQQIDINRRDARVNMLEADLERLRASYEEAQNARRVLEQTIADRLPKVEDRLTDAKKLLHARERELSELSRTAERQTRSLAEASSINAQQQSEIERLSTTLASRVSRGSATAGQRSEAEQALRSELEALRAKTREQAQLLARMQSFAGRPSKSAGAPAMPVAAFSDSSAEASNPALAEVQAELETEIRALKAKNDDQAGEIARLKAAIAVFEREDAVNTKASLRESRVALKARVQALEAQSTQQGETIAKLRRELAAANERLARQASHFTGELRRLGATGGSRGRRANPAPGSRTAPPAPERASLAERVALAQAASTTGGAGASQAASGSAGEAREDSLPSGAARPGGAGAVTRPTLVSDNGIAGTSAAESDDIGALAPEAGDGRSDGGTKPGRSTEPEAEVAGAGPARPGLLDRIANLSRTS